VESGCTLGETRRARSGSSGSVAGTGGTVRPWLSRIVVLPPPDRGGGRRHRAPDSPAIRRPAGRPTCCRIVRRCASSTTRWATSRCRPPPAGGPRRSGRSRTSPSRASPWSRRCCGPWPSSRPSAPG